MSNSSSLLIVGAGPAGMALAACLKKLSKTFDWIDVDGKTGGAYRKMYPQLMLASPVHFNSLPHLELEYSEKYIHAGDYALYLQKYAQEFDLNPTQAKLEKIEKQKNGYEVTSSKGKKNYTQIVIATGMYDFPHLPPALHFSNSFCIHSKDWRGFEKGLKKILILGAATSAIEIAEAAVHKGLEVDLSIRSPKLKPLPQKILGIDIHYWFSPFERLPRVLFPSLCAKKGTLPGTDLGILKMIKEEKIKLRSEIKSLKGKEIIFQEGNHAVYDQIISATGYHYEMNFLPQDFSSHAHSGLPKTNSKGESISHLGLYFMGIPCSQALNSAYLRGVKKDALILSKRLQDS